MGYNGHGLLEELLAITTGSWEPTTPIEDLCNNGFLGATFNTSSSAFLEASQNSSNSLTIPPFDFDPQTLVDFSSFGQDFCHPFETNIKIETQLPTQQDCSLSTQLVDGEGQNCHFMHDLGRVGSELEPHPRPVFINMGTCPERKNTKKLDGQPSKNLMAERRRRKRLNDRLSMLRSVVPKISKMDRTSILGDTIDYMKELIEKINHMQEEIEMGNSPNQLKSKNIFKDNAKPSEIHIRNSPKFDVERKNTDTLIEITCTGKPELLISTMTTLDALGLDVHRCVISCFNDFQMHVSCSEGMEQSLTLSSEDIKEALFRNAGYGGRYY